jgi:transcriptional regulator with XRE-family HTH domain
MEFDGLKIKEIAEKKGLSMYALAKGTGLTQATLSKIVNSKIGKPREKTLVAIADFLDIDPSEIGGSRVRATVEKGPSVPVYSPRELANFISGKKTTEPLHLITYPFSETEDADDALVSEYNDLVSSEILCLKVIGNSSYPLYRDGDFVFIKTSEWEEIATSYYNDCIAVCILKNENGEEFAAIRKIIVDESDRGAIWAKPINPDYPDQTIYRNPKTVGTILCFIGKPRS